MPSSTAPGYIPPLYNTTTSSTTAPIAHGSLTANLSGGGGQLHYNNTITNNSNNSNIHIHSNNTNTISNIIGKSGFAPHLPQPQQQSTASNVQRAAPLATSSVNPPVSYKPMINLPPNHNSSGSGGGGGGN